MLPDSKTKRNDRRRREAHVERRFIETLTQPSKEELRQMLAEAMRNTAGLVVPPAQKNSRTA